MYFVSRDRRQRRRCPTRSLSPPAALRLVRKVTVRAPIPQYEVMLFDANWRFQVVSQSPLENDPGRDQCSCPGCRKTFIRGRSPESAEEKRP